MEKLLENKKPKREKQQNSSCVIPGDIITYDILTRVPLESLVRFRCVCKSWSNLCVDDPLFIKLHSQRYDNYKSYSSGFIHIEYKTDPLSGEDRSSLVFINHNGKKRRIIPFNSSNTLFNRKVRILHSLNGVLLLCCEYYTYTYKDGNYVYNRSYKYYVYNPITHCSTFIPGLVDDVRSWERPPFRLYYDPLIEKYKVASWGKSFWYESKIKIITVGDGLLGDDDDPWRDVVVPDAVSLSCRNNYSHDKLCTMVKPRDLDEYYILCFDATRELYGKIKLPIEVSTLKLKCVLNEMEGLLCLSHYSIETRELKVWTLKKKDRSCDEDEDEWAEIRFKFSMEESAEKCTESSILPLMVLTVPKMKLIFEHRYDHYYSYDFESKQLEKIYCPKCRVQMHWHVNSFANC